MKLMTKHDAVPACIALLALFTTISHVIAVCYVKTGRYCCDVAVWQQPNTNRMCCGNACPDYVLENPFIPYSALGTPGQAERVYYDNETCKWREYWCLEADPCECLDTQNVVWSTCGSSDPSGAACP